MKVLGIDPGFSNTGWVLCEYKPTSAEVLDLGLIRTDQQYIPMEGLKSDDNIRRVGSIYAQLCLLAHKFNFQAVCMEAFSFMRNASVACKVAMCHSAVVCLTEQFGLALVTNSPYRIRKALFSGPEGKVPKKVGKNAIQDKVDSLHPNFRSLLSGTTIAKRYYEHIYDAMAVVCGCQDSEVLSNLANGLESSPISL